MKIWITKNSEVSVGDQIVEQITLGIASRDLAPDERLPSIREVARRFKIHSNTVLTAYQRLASSGLVTFKKGSGVYVRSEGVAPAPQGLDTLLDRFFADAAAIGFGKEEATAYLQRTSETSDTCSVLLIESDAELGRIVAAEIADATEAKVEIIPRESFTLSYLRPDLRIVAMFDEREKLSEVLPTDAGCIFLNANSVPAAMAGRDRPSNSELIAVISEWERFLGLAKLFLLAAKIDGESIVTRSPDTQEWRKGLGNVALIICDTLTARHFPDDKRVRIFPIVATASLDELRTALRN